MKNIVLIISMVCGVTISAGMLEKGSACYDKGELKKAMGFWSTGCNKGDVHSCDRLGMMYYFGYGTPQNQILAEKLYQKACIAGLVDDCFKVARMYDYGYSVEKDRAKALEFYKRACDNNMTEACSRYDVIIRSE